jgi:two-component system response regulator YesN
MSYKVVIIDDEKWTREVIKGIVNWEKLGVEVVGEASDGEFGLEIIKRTNPDIVISDVCMPRLNGLELIEKIKENGFESLIIMISGYDDFSYVQSALRLGVSDYILKPVRASILNEQLENCVKIIKNKRKKANVGLDLNFVSNEYANYISYRITWLNDALLSGSEEKIKTEFDILEEQIQIKFSKIQRRDFIIYFYYRLLNNLQNYIVGCGYQFKQIFSSKFTSFVFGDDTKFIRMLTYLEELYIEANRKIIEFKNKRNKLDISKIMAYITLNYLEEVSLERTAELFSVSKEYLSKIFKDEYKISFSKYIIKLRMEKAMQFVINPSIPLKDIPESSGFFDHAHFYKTFKKFYEKTPGEIRATLKKHNESD